MERVRLYPQNEADGGSATREGVGLFAAVLLEHMPHHPVEEEGRLNDPMLREQFFERVFAHRRWRRFRATSPSVGQLMEFHAAAKMSLLAHHERRYRELGRIVAAASKQDLGATLDEYEDTYFDIYRHRATRRRHANVLQHLAGHVKKEIDDDDRAELTGVIDQYRTGSLPLIVPITLLRHHARRVGSEWLRSQTYLDPYPDELMLRNHV